jgi:hypothetical protein
MSNIKIFCLSIYNKNNVFFEKFNFTPVGLGNKIFCDSWLLDNTGNNISIKNKYYGEYSFHYWLWKNYITELSRNEWIGFCTYRRFWTFEDCETKGIGALKKNIITNVPKSWGNSDVILAKKLVIGKIKNSKIIKNFGVKNTILNLEILFKAKHNLLEHFKIFHGSYHINEAIKLLPKKDRSGFEEYLNNFSFNPHNLFICRGPKILEEFYKNIFSWLFKCENKFDMNKLRGYEIRMLGFLAEHFVSYWFQKNYSIYENPITFFDTNINLP